MISSFIVPLFRLYNIWTITKELVKGLVDLEIRGQVETIVQKTEILPYYCILNFDRAVSQRLLEQDVPVA